MGGTRTSIQPKMNRKNTICSFLVPNPAPMLDQEGLRKFFLIRNHGAERGMYMVVKHNVYGSQRVS